MNECLICYSELISENTLKINNNLDYNTCIDCVKYQLENNLKIWINSLKNEDCEATIIRMLSSGIPLQLDKDIEKFYFNDKVISCYYFKDENISKIKKINQDLFQLKEKIKDNDFYEKLELILNKIDIN